MSVEAKERFRRFRIPSRGRGLSGYEMRCPSKLTGVLSESRIRVADTHAGLGSVIRFLQWVTRLAAGRTSFVKRTHAGVN